jgi:hypothetical protein
MIPLVMANEQGSVQAFNPSPWGQELWSTPCLSVPSSRLDLARYSVTEGFNPVCWDCVYLR